MARSVASVALLAIALVASGCRHWPARGRSVADCPGELVSTEAIAGDFLLRQRVRVVTGDGVHSLELVAQKRGEELLLLGLDPFGVELFTLRQRGVQTRVDARSPRLLAVPPENLLRDLHRIRFLTIAGRPDDGQTPVLRGGTEIAEVWDAGGLRRRSFRRLEDDPENAVVVDFGPPDSGVSRAGRVEVRNPGCGYVASFATLSEQALP